MDGWGYLTKTFYIRLTHIVLLLCLNEVSEDKFLCAVKMKPKFLANYRCKFVNMFSSQFMLMIEIMKACHL